MVHGRSASASLGAGGDEDARTLTLIERISCDAGMCELAHRLRLEQRTGEAEASARVRAHSSLFTSLAKAPC